MLKNSKDSSAVIKRGLNPDCIREGIHFREMQRFAFMSNVRISGYRGRQYFPMILFVIHCIFMGVGVNSPVPFPRVSLLSFVSIIDRTVFIFNEVRHNIGLQNTRFD